MKKCYFSNRIYKHKVPHDVNQELSHSLRLYNRAVRMAYAWQTKHLRTGNKPYEGTLHLAIKKRFQLDNYYTNSAVQQANALRTSQKELQALYVKQVDIVMKSIQKKLKKERSKLTALRNMKQSIVDRKPKLHKRMGYRMHQTASGVVYALHRKNETQVWFSPYLFEHRHLDKEIKRLKARIGQLRHRLLRQEQKKEKLRREIPSVLFGSRSFFRKQYTMCKDQKSYVAWRHAFCYKRNAKMTLSGRKDAKYGNFVFQYDAPSQTLHIRSTTGRALVLPYVYFPYGQDQVQESIARQLSCQNKKKDGKPIGWSIEDHGTYYIIKCIVEEPEHPHLNHAKADGVIGVDVNYNHIAFSNVNGQGQLLSSSCLYFSLAGKRSGQITKILEAEAIRLVDIAVQRNKPIVLEALDTTLSKSAGRYRNRKQNRRMSLFAYKKMQDGIHSRAAKMGIAVFEVNPAFTSQIGKMKYMKQMHISIHQAASYVIGRRGMNLKEQVPKLLRIYTERKDGEHHWKQWSVLTKAFKALRPHVFYHVSGQSYPLFNKEICNYGLTQVERDSLQKYVPKIWLEEREA
ncbi:IS200/IS605 family accessory protein TnpB-related protein [Ectobacillus funiculus]|uniref:IS200/IS605 family accessory protein TnpB-related protein n=1 Tax=Ectobacillus funiculus TaxID=137993 RepID=UPI00101D112A|nr:IS200/IS605 family accessory protein TnpB-related protein [Ectobacillus funiculus]